MHFNKNICGNNLINKLRKLVTLLIQKIWRKIQASPEYLRSLPVNLHPKNILKYLRNISPGKVFKKLIKWSAITVVTLSVTIFVLLFIASIIFDEEDINRNLSKVLRDSTGAGINVEATSFNISTGIALRNMRIYPIDLLKVSEEQQTPLISVDEISLKYNILRFLIGEVGITEALIKNPKIQLIQQEGTWNYQPILEFLDQSKSSEEDLPSESEEKPNKEDSNPQPSKSIEDILPIHPASVLIVPFKLLIQKIGFSNLIVDMVKIKESKKVSHLNMSGISANAEVTWFATNSEISANILSEKNHDFRFFLDQISPETGKLIRNHDISMTLDQSLSLKNLNDISLISNTNILWYKSKEKTVKNLPLKIDILVSLLESLDGVAVKRSNINLLDTILMDAHGTFKVYDKYIDKFALDISLSSKVLLNKANVLAKSLDLPLKLDGEFEIKKLQVKGPLEPAKLSKDLSNKSLPEIAAQFAFDDIKIDSKSPVIKLAPVNGYLDISTISSPTDDGFQIKSDSNIRIDGIEISHHIDGKPSKIDVQDIQTTLAGQFNYPSLVAPFVRSVTEIQQINATLEGQSPISFPLVSEIYGSVGQDFSKINIDTKIDIPQLFELDLDLRCKNRCNTFKIKKAVSISDFEILYSLIQPFVLKVSPLAFIPEYFRGKLEFNTKLRGSSKNITEKNISKLIEGTKGQISTEIALNNFSLKIPFKNTVIDDLQTQISLNGTFREHILEITQRFKEIKTDLEPEKALRLNHYDFSTKVNNSFPKGLSPNNILDSITTEIDTNLYLGKIHLDKVTPVPINGISLETQLKQKDAKRVDIEQLSLKIPDIGAEIGLEGNTHLKNFKPYAFEVTTKVIAQGTGGSPLANGVETKGKVEISNTVKTDDLNKIIVKGKAHFANFGIKVPGHSPGDQPILVVEDMVGDIPLTQKIIIDEILKSTKKTPQKNVNLEESQEIEYPTIDVIEEYFTKNQQQHAGETNLVGHVDYPGMKVFYPDNQTLTISRVSAANLDLKQIEIDIEVKQGWFSLSQFVISFLGGKIQGDMKLAFNPLPDELKLSLHITRLNTHKLINNFPHLKNKAKSWDLFANPYIDANVHINFDINNSDLAGGIDITTIGKEQLRMMLFYLDPDDKNPSISTVRDALAFGDLSKVSVPIKNGLIGLDVEISVLAIPIPLPKMNNFPIGQLISNIGSSAKEETLNANDI